MFIRRGKVRGFFGPPKAPPFIISDVPGYKLDWDSTIATSLGSPVDDDLITQWDELASGFDAVQGTMALQPTYKTNIQNGLPIVRFRTTTNNVLISSLIDSAIHFPDQKYTWFVVCQTRTFNGNQNLFNYTGGSVAQSEMRVLIQSDQKPQAFSGSIALATSTYDTFKLMTVTKEVGASGFKVYTNGILEDTQTGLAVSGHPHNAPMFLGAANSGGGGPGYVDIGRLVVFNEIVSTSNRKGTEKSLMDFWGITP